MMIHYKTFYTSRLLSFDKNIIMVKKMKWKRSEIEKRGKRKTLLTKYN